jgi:hypothetical protein
MNQVKKFSYPGIVFIRKMKDGHLKSSSSKKVSENKTNNLINLE